MAFAKLYGEGDDQILVKLDNDQYDAPELRFYCQPPDFGVCSFSINFEGSEAGWDKAEAAFEKVTEESAREAIRKAFRTGIRKAFRNGYPQ